MIPLVVLIIVLTGLFLYALCAFAGMIEDSEAKDRERWLKEMKDEEPPNNQTSL